MQASSLPDEETLVRLVVAKRQSTVDEIQFLLGHVSIQTTERYLGCKQKLRFAVNGRMGIEPDNPPVSQ